MFSTTLLLTFSPALQAPCCDAGQEQAAALELEVSAVAEATAGRPAGQITFGLTSQGQGGQRRTRTLVLDAEDMENADLEALFQESGGEMPEILSQLGYASEEEVEGEHGYLGLMIGEAEDGVSIEGVYGGSGAARAGLRSGDVIRRVGKKNVSSIEELMGFIQKREAGSEVRVRVERGDGWIKDTVIELVARDELGDVEGQEQEEWGPSVREIGPRVLFGALGDDEDDGHGPRQMRVQVVAPEGDDEGEIEVHVLEIGAGGAGLGFDLNLEDLEGLKGLRHLPGLEGLDIDLDDITGQIEIHVEVEDDGGERRVLKHAMRLGDGQREAGNGFPGQARGRWFAGRRAGDGETRHESEDCGRGEDCGKGE
ncbi:MAG: hypothetical protein CMK00_02825, partial [Planctomycetes bacterium]|nr:hypothetical protein [Planctomycetota bacterium]